MSNTTKVKIDGTFYDVPTPAARLLSEYAENAHKAIKAYERLSQLAERVRHLQTEYFRTRNSLLLRTCKAAEQELDDYLSGKTQRKEQEAQQAELFR